MNLKQINITEFLKNSFGKLLCNFAYLLYLTLFHIIFCQNSWAALPDCLSVVNPDPGSNCLIDNLPLCKSTKAGQTILGSGTLPDPRINCMNVIHLPLCSELPSSEQKPLANCVNECQANNSTNHNKTCVKFCNPLSSQEVSDCKNPQCHQVQDADPISEGSSKNCDMANCIYLTKDELDNPKFKDNLDKKYCEGNTNFCFEFSIDKLEHLTTSSDNRLCKLHYCKPRTFYCGRGFVFDYVDQKGDQTINIRNREQDQSGFVAKYEETILKTFEIDSSGEEVAVAGNLDYTATCDDSLQNSCKQTLAKEIFCGTENSNSECSAPVAKCNNKGKCLKASFECMTAFNFSANININDSTSPTIDESCLLDCTSSSGGFQTVPECDYINSCETYEGHNKEDKYCKKIIDCNNFAYANGDYCSTITQNYDTSNTSPDAYTYPETESWFYRPSPHVKAFKNGKPEAQKNDPESYRNQFRVFRTKGIDDGNKYNICYDKQDLKDNDFGKEVELLGYFHDYLGMNTRVPGNCSGDGSKFNGNRSVNYEGLCGVMTAFEKVSQDDQTAYFKDYVTTNYNEGKSFNNTKYNVTICTRYSNTLIPDRTCGARECGITYGFDKFWGNACGFDVCKTLVIEDNNPKRCIFTNQNTCLNDTREPNFLCESVDNESCSAKIDQNVRVRVVKYDNYICAFLDTRDKSAVGGGIFLTNGDTIQAVDELRHPELRYCMTGDGNEPNGEGDVLDQCPNAFNYENKFNYLLTHVWRPFYQIPYVDKSYYMKKGSNNLIMQQKCAKVELKTSPRIAFAIANSTNTPELFIPQLYISKVFDKKGSQQEIIKNNDPKNISAYYGTDFFQPKIEVSLGKDPNIKTENFELDINEESSDEKTLTVTFINSNYSVNVYVKKTSNPATGDPLICAYRTIAESAPVEIGCVPRKKPRIGNVSSLDQIMQISQSASCSPSDQLIDNEKVVISMKEGSNYNESFAQVQLQNIDSCKTISSEIKVPDELEVACNGDIEKYRICLQREECSQLNIERVKNEIAIANAFINNESPDDFIIKRDFYESLAKKCRVKAGFLIDGEQEIDYSQDSYGWFNEVCIIDSFDHDLKYVVAKKVANGLLLGECIIDEEISVKNTQNNQCQDGGNPKLGCYCKIADSSTSPATNQTIRKQTHREAGLCVDIPEPTLCPAINFNTPESDNSLGKTDINNIDQSHKNRSASNTQGAEFGQAYEGSTQYGLCNGFWKMDSSKGSPTAKCSTGGDWDFMSIENGCIRYSCNAIETGGNPDENGEYPNIIFDLDELGDDKGSRYGFAEWPKIISSDVAKIITASKCIPGFKPVDAGYKSIDSQSSIQDNSINNIDLIISKSTSNKMSDDYSNLGNLPTMKCNQTGFYDSLKNSCQRIKCYFKDPPRDVSNNNDFILWNETGGAVFTPERIRKNTNSNRQQDEVRPDEISNSNFDHESISDYGYGFASRSNQAIQSESKIYGECNNNLGFFQVSGRPYRECDHKGNLGPVQDKCATRCLGVSEVDSIDSNGLPTEATSEFHGNALWQQIFAYEQPVVSTASNCKNGYKKYPYKPIRDQQGRYYKTSYNRETFIPYHVGTQDTYINSTISFDYSQDSRNISLTNPKRSCVPVTVLGVDNIANVWSKTDSDCIDKCPGFDQDSRIGVGATIHPFSMNANGELIEDQYIINNARFGDNKILVKWNSISFNNWQHIEFKNNQDNLQTGDFGPNRTNNYFSLSRKCNADGTWGEPIINCIASGGNLADDQDNIKLTANNPNNFGYRVPSKGVNLDSIPGDVLTSIAGECRNSYFYPKNAVNLSNINSFNLKKYSCSPLDDEKYIDQFYFKFTPTPNLESQYGGDSIYYDNACVKKCAIPNENGRTLRFLAKQGSTYLDNNTNPDPNLTPQEIIELKVNSSNAGKLYSDEQSISGTCPNNYGNEYQGNRTPISDVTYNCNVESISKYTDRSANEPHLTCFTFSEEPARAAQWQSQYPCNKCRDCTIGSDDKVSGETKIYGNEEMCVDINWNEMRFKYWYYDLPSSIAHNSIGSKCRYHAQECYDNAKFCNTRADLKYTCKDSFLSLYWTASNKDCNNERHWGYKNEHDEQCKGRGQCLDCHKKNCNGLSSIPLGAGANASASDSAWNGGRGCPSIQKP